MEYVPIQVYVGSKSTLAEGSSFGSTRGTENEVTDTMEVRTLCVTGARIIPTFYYTCLELSLLLSIFFHRIILI